MSATEELRRLLDERGVEWEDSSNENVLHTAWNGMNCWFNEFPDGWTAWGMLKRGTPQQAIDATLGRGTCHNAMPLLSSGMPYPDSWMCSECGGRMDGIILEVGNYCPNCGREVVNE